MPFLLVIAGAPAAALPDDRVIAASAQESYVYRVLLEGRVTLTVVDGHVILAGTVLDRDLRFLAADLAGALPGVARVENRVVVDTTMQERSDPWRALMIHKRLLMRTGVSAADVRIVVVDEGMVTLRGTARDEAQKALTERYAKQIHGVVRVNNQILVRAFAADPPGEVERIDDPSVITQARYALRTHPETGRLRPEMTSSDGRVTISGPAASETERALVTEVVSGVRGVVTVSNAMHVKG